MRGSALPNQPTLSEVAPALIAPDLAIDRLALVVPDGSDVMVVLTTLANGDHENADPRRVLADRLAELDHIAVGFVDTEDPDLPQVRMTLPGLTLHCEVRPAPDGGPERMALQVVAIKPSADLSEGSKVLTITAANPIVSAGNGVVSDTHRIVDWRIAGRQASGSEQLYATLKLVERLEAAEKGRAQTQRTRFIAAREAWRCKTCRAFWRPDQHQRCPSCGREFTDIDFRQPEVGKVEFTVPEGEPIQLQPDAAVLVEPEDEPNFVGRVSRVDHGRHTVEVVCRTFEHAGSEGWITPSFNKALYQAKRSVLAAIATKDFSVGLLGQLLVRPDMISAPQVDLADEPRDWLTSGMFSNPPQDRAVALVSRLRAGQAVFIQGPPGTGKTTVIVEAIKRRLARDPEERILVTSHSNLAVDNALERLAGTPGMRAVRVARAERVHPSVDQFRCDDEDDPRLLSANCYFATCATAATSAITDMTFDLVILDEGNKARADEALPCLRLGAALALVGDHKQLPPVEDDALYGIVETDPMLEDLVNRSLFEQCWDGGLRKGPRCLLTVQHRMHPQIADYVSRASYDCQLEDAAEVQAYAFVTRKPFPVALHFVDTEGMRGGRERRGPGGALRNEAEVRVAAQVVRLLDERCPRELSMAVIAMYAEQVERLRQALGRRKFKRAVKIDTVDSFEGREEDLVVISLVRSNERGRIGFLRVPNRLNVAISRARRLVACIGDSATLRSGEESMYGELVDAARRGGGWVSASELVTTSKRGRGGQQRRRGDIAAEAGDGAEAIGTSRRRRRGRKRSRGGQARVVTTIVAEDGSVMTVEAAASPDGAVPAAGADGQQPGRRRRRRRRRGQRAPTVRAPDAAGADLPADSAEAGSRVPPEQDGSREGRSRRRRRRRRRGGAQSAPFGGAPGAPAAPAAASTNGPVAPPAPSPEEVVIPG